MTARGLLLYDADCGFCTRSAAQVPRLGLDVDIASIQESDLAALGVDAERAEREVPFVDAQGRVTYGHEAFAAALATGAVPWRLVGGVLGSRLLRRPAGAAYAWVAAHRHRLPGGTPQCSLEDR